MGCRRHCPDPVTALALARQRAIVCRSDLRHRLAAAAGRAQSAFTGIATGVLTCLALHAADTPKRGWGHIAFYDQGTWISTTPGARRATRRARTPAADLVAQLRAQGQAGAMAPGCQSPLRRHYGYAATALLLVVEKDQRRGQAAFDRAGWHGHDLGVAQNGTDLTIFVHQLEVGRAVWPRSQ